MADSSPHFDVHPSVVLKLGEELIADEFTAIVEAAKNSYDAGASKIRIRIDTENPPGERFQSKYPKAKGTILISDDGEGMDADVINAGWLIISYSRKRDLKRELTLSKRRGRRIPLGDKGIGRLGLQRLGENVEVFTSTGDDSGHHMAFRWSDFEKASTLSEVPVSIEPSKRKLKRGTEVLVSGLKSPGLWKGQPGRDRLQSKLSQMVSPFDELRECDIDASLNGTSLDLAQFSRKVLAVAELHYDFAFDGAKLTIRGEYSLDYLRLAAEGKSGVQSAIEKDDGKSLVDYLCQRSSAVAAHLAAGKKANGRLTATHTIQLNSLGGAAFEKGSAVSPGPFKGEFFHFDRRERATGFDRANDFKAFLDTQRGVRIYRNGFAFGRYGVDGTDWLGLGESWTEGTSWYGLKPANILGYVSVTAADNPLLVEKTDREGLTDSPAASNFFRLVQEVTRYANLVNTHVRRGVVEFEKELDLEESGETTLDEETVSRRLGQGRSAAKRVKRAVERPDRERPPTVADVNEVEKALAIAQALTTEVERLKVENRSLLDLAGLGLTAEALSHEIGNIADQLSRRMKTLSSLVGRMDLDPRVFEFIEHVRGAINALRKQLSHLAPALRFARERKERFDVRDFARDSAEYFKPRLQEKGIELKADLGDDPFPVRMSRGKLTQVVDNLVLNSEYWLGEQLRRNSNNKALAKIRVRPPHLYVSDSGPGVDESIEPRLFQPFVTLKPKGRGLGLFIVRQLLDSMGCSVALKADRNQAGRRYIFDVDLSGAIDNDNEA